MQRNEEFRTYVVYDLLSAVPGVASRAMFGGYGIYKDGRIFAIIVESKLYFKADDTTKKFFEKHESRPFTYTKKNGKSYTMNYYLVPEEIMEDRESLPEWVDVALSARKRDE